MNSFLTKIIIIILALGLIISLGVGTEFANFGMSRDIVAKVGDENITKEEFNFFKNKELLNLPNEIKSNPDYLKILDLQIINMISKRKALSIAGKSMGFYVSDKEIRDKILNSNVILNYGDIKSSKEYKEIIKKSFGIDSNVFESILFEEAIVEKLSNFLDASVVISEEDIVTSFKLRETKINYIKINFNSDTLNPIKFTKDEVEKFKASMKNESFLNDIPVELFIINPSDLVKDGEVSDSDIVSYYENYGKNKDFDKEVFKKEISEKIGEARIISRYEEILLLSNSMKFEDIAKNFNKSKEILTYVLPDAKLPDYINQQITSSDNEINILIHKNKIWVTKKTKIDTAFESYVLNLMKQNLIKRAENSFFDETFKIFEERPDDFYDILNSDKRASIQFLYDESLINSPELMQNYDFLTLANEKNLLINKIFKSKNYNYLVFLEKIRVPDINLLVLDRDKIKKNLIMKKRSILREKILSDLIKNVTVKLNPKYFSD